MLSIKVNNTVVQLLQPIEGEIASLVIVNSFLPKPIQSQHVQRIADWLWDLSQRAGSIEYNKVLMQSSDVNRYV